MKLSSGAVVMGAVFALTLGVRASGIGQQPPAQQPADRPPAPQGPFAPEKFKNIQVLKDLPADQLDGVMRFMAASLGVNCEFCHVSVPEGDWPMEKDDKKTKQTARQMIEMTRTINAQSFEGSTRVNCASCHHGQQEPNRIPPLAVPFTPEQIAAAAARAQAQAQVQAQTQEQGPGGRAGAPAGAGGRGGPGGRGPARPAETLDQIVDKYIQALGGRPALEKLQSRVMRGTLTNRAGQSLPVSVEEKRPGKYRQTIETPAGPAVRASNGTTTWQQNAGVTHEVTIPFEQQEITRLADLGLPLQLKERYQNLAASRYAKLDDKDVILVTGRTAPSVTEQLYFDRNSGLLLRRVISTRTAMGTLPEQIDYSDYRDVNGVKVPFQIVRASWDYHMTQKFTDVKVNVPVEDARFDAK